MYSREITWFTVKCALNLPLVRLVDRVSFHSSDIFRHIPRALTSALQLQYRAAAAAAAAASGHEAALLSSALINLALFKTLL